MAEFDYIADTVYNSIATNEELIDKISKEILSSGRELSERQFKKALNTKMKLFINNLKLRVTELQEILSKEEKAIMDIRWWCYHIHVQGLGDSEAKLFDISEADLNRAFVLVNEIAAMLRGEEDVVLRVSLLTDEGVVEVFDVPESAVKARPMPASKGEELRYNLKELKEYAKKVEISESFEQHYKAFFEKANDMISRARSAKYKKANQGHITEAFYEHFNTVHPGVSMADDVPFHDDFTSKIVGSLLDAAVKNKIGWWAAGDVANLQIKALNERLASVQSIKIMANELMYFFSQEQFNWEGFYTVFTEKGQKKVQQQVKSGMKNINKT